MAKLIATEAQEAKALMEWAKTHPLARDYLFHISNEGKRGWIAQKQFKEGGGKKGIPDYFFAYPSHKDLDNILNSVATQTIAKGMSMIYSHYAGLWIELKSKTGKLSKEQKDILQSFENVGYKCVVAYGWEQAKNAILNYLGEEADGVCV